MVHSLPMIGYCAVLSLEITAGHSFSKKIIVESKKDV